MQVAAVRRVDAGLEAVVGDGQQSQRQPVAPGHVGGHGRERHPLTQQCRAVQVQREVPVAEGEPRLVAETDQFVTDGEALVSPAPLLLRMDEPGQPVGDGVEVGADAQTVQLEVVTDVHDDGDVLRSDDRGEAAEEARGTDTTSEDDDHPRSFASSDCAGLRLCRRTMLRQAPSRPSAGGRSVVSTTAVIVGRPSRTVPAGWRDGRGALA